MEMGECPSPQYQNSGQGLHTSHQHWVTLAKEPASGSGERKFTCRAK